MIYRSLCFYLVVSDDLCNFTDGSGKYFVQFRDVSCICLFCIEGYNVLQSSSIYFLALSAFTTPYSWNKITTPILLIIESVHPHHGINSCV